MPNRAVWPSTPPAKRRMSNWHGLPSPHTPTSDKELYKTTLLSLEGGDQVDGRTGADVHATKVTEQALTTLSLPQESFHQVEGIACDHDESSIAVPASTRRSTRARKHVVSYSMYRLSFVHYAADNRSRSLAICKVISRHPKSSQGQACVCSTRITSLSTLRVDYHTGQSGSHPV